MRPRGNIGARRHVLLAMLTCLAAAGGGLAISVAEDKLTTSVRPNSNSDPVETLAPGIVGSAHDFSAGGQVARDLCLPCHAPHITATEAPLLVGRAAASQPARAYATPAGELNAASLVCLSCHDGTVARDVYAGAHAMRWSDLSSGGTPPGGVRVTNHPVGIRYPDGRADYHSSATVVSDGRIRLPDGRIQCTTCHDPHNTHRHPGMLVVPNDRSRLCLSCHRL